MALVTIDFDGTLFQGNSFKVMFQAAKKDFTAKEWASVAVGLIKAGAKGIKGGKQAFKHQFFRAFAKGFKGKTKQELDDFFMQLVHMGKDHIHQGLVTQIHEHRKQGDVVVVLSGALRPFLDAVIKTLKLDVHATGTKLQYNTSGVATGKLGTIVNGDVKVEKVKAWIEALQTQNKYSAGDTWAYADSLSDIPLLQFVDHPVVVNPNDAMKQAAEEHGWPMFNDSVETLHI